MLRFAALLASLTLPVSLHAQPQPHDTSAPQTDRMAPFTWLVGEWHGSGWFAGADGTRRTFESREIVVPKLSGMALLVEGRHHAPGEPNNIVHDAMAMLVWDQRANAYRFRTQLSTGVGGDYVLEPTANGFIWRLDTPGGQIVYTVTNDNGRWVERGRRTLPNGQAVDFFEMTLTRR